LLMRQLLVATSNTGKLREYRSLLDGLPFKLISLKELAIEASIEETGASLEENARTKATAASRLSGLLALADDSGLEVDALGGEPGVRSARYAGENADDEERVRYLLSKLADVPWEKRQARFRCVIAIAELDGRTEIVDGTCHGYIAFEPKGTDGFGYDPIFYLPSLDKTLAELPPHIKDLHSHRGQAAQRARSLLLAKAEREEGFQGAQGIMGAKH